MTTVADLQLELAYRLGEQSAATDPTEKARRLAFLNAGYRDVMRRHYWWFTESYATFSSQANKESYTSADGVPTNLRQILELRFQNRLYRALSQDDFFQGDTKPYSTVSNAFYMYAGELFFVPVLTATVADGIKMKYYANYEPLVEDDDVILIPDQFSDVLVAYAEARVAKTDDERGGAADAFDEFNEIIQMMTEEHNKYYLSLKDSEPDSIALFE